MYVFFGPQNQLRIDFVGYASRTAEVGTGPLSPGHGDRGLVANLMSSHRAATLLVRNQIVTSACPRAITCCGDASTEFSKIDPHATLIFMSEVMTDDAPVIINEI